MKLEITKKQKEIVYKTYTNTRKITTKFNTVNNENIEKNFYIYDKYTSNWLKPEYVYDYKIDFDRLFDTTLKINNYIDNFRYKFDFIKIQLNANFFNITILYENLKYELRYNFIYPRIESYKYILNEKNKHYEKIDKIKNNWDIIIFAYIIFDICKIVCRQLYHYI